MIQQIMNSIKLLSVRKNGFAILFLVTSSSFIGYLLAKHPLTDVNDIKELLESMIQFSGIFSAIIISYTIGKVFQIRNERIEKQREIIRLSNKLTDFRRIAKELKRCSKFWNREMIDKMNSKYSSLSVFDIYNWNTSKTEKYSKLDELRKSYHNDNICGGKMYLEMRTLSKSNPYDKLLHDSFDYNHTYSIEYLELLYDFNIGNSLWYCLTHNYQDYKSCFDFSALSIETKEKVLTLSQKIDSKKYQSRSFDRELLADVGNDMQSFYIPRLYELTYYNTAKPKVLSYITSLLSIILVIGVLVPLILMSIKIEPELLHIISNFSVFTLSVTLSAFVLTFKSILNDELKVS